MEVYFLCPKCGCIAPKWVEDWDIYVNYIAHVDRGGRVKRVKNCVEGEAGASSIACYVCLKRLNPPATDYLVGVEDGKLVAAGRYWLEHLGELRKTAESHCFLQAVEIPDGIEEIEKFILD